MAFAGFVYVGRIRQVAPGGDAATLRLEDQLYLNDRIVIQGPGTDIRLTITAIRINDHPEADGMPGETVTIPINAPVCVGDSVYVLLTPADLVD